MNSFIVFCVQKYGNENTMMHIFISISHFFIFRTLPRFTYIIYK